MNTEKLRHIISIIGEERVEKLYDFTGGEKISFAVLYKQILSDKIKQRINAGHSFKQIAKEYYISRMTVYRILRRSKRK
jgi:Mor family transcriptional regulator